uniref:Uncharacterized protein n=1 Tax=Rousettus aegyptiacus TaxID=9407 RepID=A0A7J8C2M3_ROUAE|nr:hypothetical protein HJG63_009408 [Rousettus aegyptiacus]
MQYPSTPLVLFPAKPLSALPFPRQEGRRRPPREPGRQQLPQEAQPGDPPRRRPLAIKGRWAGDSRQRLFPAPNPRLWELRRGAVRRERLGGEETQPLSLARVRGAIGCRLRKSGRKRNSWRGKCFRGGCLTA